MLFAAATAAWRIAAQVRGWKLPPKWLRIVVVVLAVVSVLAGYRTLNGLEAGTALLVLMAASKLLETRDRRDLTVLLFIAFVLLFAALLYEQGLMQLPYMLVAVWLLTATLMRVHQTTSRMPMREAMRMTAKMLLLSLPVAVAFFVAVSAPARPVLGAAGPRGRHLRHQRRDLAGRRLGTEPVVEASHSASASPARTASAGESATGGASCCTTSTDAPGAAERAAGSPPLPPSKPRDKSTTTA